MFERYTDDARKVLFFARYEASRLGSPALEPEHLWLGFLRENKRLMRRLAPEITVDAIHARLIQRGLMQPHGERTSITADLPLAASTAQALGNAATGADNARNRYITSEALVVSLLHYGL